MIINSGSKQKKNSCFSFWKRKQPAGYHRCSKEIILGLGEVVLVVSDRKDAFALESSSRGYSAVFHNPLQYPGKKIRRRSFKDTSAKPHSAHCLGWIHEDANSTGYRSILPRYSKYSPLSPSFFSGKQGVQDALDYG